MDSQKQQLSERLKQANNILVTVSSNPTVDQLASCIGLTLVLNHMGKHATAVFSGDVPSTIEFLKPEETLEKNTDSLRDFIISLDKSKADKLRYKVEDKVVKIFITPYKTSITQDDLDFSQGDFNVDVVVALGVHDQQELDQAITAHGRILHDATVATVNTAPNGELGSINWVDTTSSSLSELVTSLAQVLDKAALDVQTSTALLTGIVAATDRFSNDRTTPKTMSASATLMAAGANPQLIATELEADIVPAEQPIQQGNIQQDQPQNDQPKRDDGTLEIEHMGASTPPAPEPPAEEPSPEPELPPEPPQPQIHVDDNGQFTTLNNEPLPGISKVRGVSSGGRITDSDSGHILGEEPEQSLPSEVGAPHGDSAQPAPMLTANSADDAVDPASDELTLPVVNTPLLTHNETVLPSQNPVFTPPAPEPPAAPAMPTIDTAQMSQPPETNTVSMPQPPSITPDETLTEIERSVGSPHAVVNEQDSDVPSVGDARSAVEAALNATSENQPIAALNALPLGENLHQQVPEPTFQPSGPVNTGFSEPTPGNTPADDTLDMPIPPSNFTPQQQTPAPQTNPFYSPQPMQPQSGFNAGTSQQGVDPNSPPPVPPPMLPPLQ